MTKEERLRRTRRRKREQRIERSIAETIPIISWDRETLTRIAYDRGFRTEASISYGIGKTLGVTTRSAKNLIETGRFTWGQVLVLGDMFEMSPKEFCDCFLHGYFRETAVGTFRAHVDNPIALLQSPIRVQSLEEKSKSVHGMNEER